jgi:predicted kinase
MNRRVYETMVERASVALTAGHTVVADAVYARPIDREGIAGLARKVGVPFIGLWIDGPREILARRLRERVGDASDATADVLDLQIGAGTGVVDWHRLDGSTDAASLERAARAIVVKVGEPATP